MIEPIQFETNLTNLAILKIDSFFH